MERLVFDFVFLTGNNGKIRINVISGRLVVARISHELTTAVAYTSVLTALCSVGLLDVLYKYDCGGFTNGRMSCQAGVSTASLRNSVRNAG